MAPDPNIARALAEWASVDPAGSRAAVAERLSKAPAGAASEVATDLVRLLRDLPDEGLAKEWAWLCGVCAASVAASPQGVLDALHRVRQGLLRRSGARLWMAAGPDGDALAPDIEGLVSELGELKEAAAPSVPMPRNGGMAVLRARMTERGGDGGATHVALLDSPRTAGVLQVSAPLMTPGAVSDEALLDLLTARSFSGDGAHSVAERVSAAGLAYSNGVGASVASGRVSLYAERCPNVASTLRLVLATIQAGASSGVDLGEYTVAQSFGTRTGGSYEHRTTAMANNVADGWGPEVVRRIRSRVLELRERNGLSAELQRRRLEVYERLLPGLGEARTAADGVSSVVIGDERQLESWSSLIAELEAVVVARIYARDFWLP